MPLLALRGIDLVYEDEVQMLTDHLRLLWGKPLLGRVQLEVALEPVTKISTCHVFTRWVLAV